MHGDYVYRRYQKRQPQGSGMGKGYAALATLILLIVTILFLSLYPKDSKENKEVAITPTATSTPAPKRNFPNILSVFSIKKQQTIQSEETLMADIKSLTEKKHGMYSVYIYDISQDKGYGFNETMIVTAASISKIPIIASLYYLAQGGTIDLDERITLQANDIQDFGTGILRYNGAGNVYSLKTLANLLIKKSDNTAGYVLGEKIIGFEKIEELIGSWGLTQTNMEQNKTSNLDISRLLVKMFKGNIASTPLTTEMMGTFVDTDFENRLPRDIPKDIKVYHKIGNEVGVIHDAGIVALPNHPYYIGVLTNDIIDIPGTEDTIAEISKMVYDFYTESAKSN